jgi:hypothetical protein
LSDEIAFTDEGSHSLLRKKAERPIIETQRMTPSVTIIRGQNSSAISQKVRGIWDWDCECESSFVMKMENVNGQYRFQKDIQKALIIGSYH